MQSFEPTPISSEITIVSKRGVTYKQYSYFGGWFIEGTIRKPDGKFIGASFNLPKGIKEKAKKLLTKREIEYMFCQ
jgi:hypothetical protein